MSSMKLPFLQDSKWPVMREEPEERVVNPSYDKQLQDHLVDEVMSAHAKKDARAFRESLMSLIHSIKYEDSSAM